MHAAPRIALRSIRATAAALLLAFAVATLLAQRPLPDRLAPPTDAAPPLVLDRTGRPLQLVYDGGWNLHQQVALMQVPLLLRAALVGAEDRRYWAHSGVDWRARVSALWQNLRAGRALRGASTISEQVVRLLHPRPRTLWSRWVETFEALRLEARFSKHEILEFYVNQLPYGANRRGVVQAAQHYFGRGLETLTAREMLALAVLPRAPSRLARDPAALQAGIDRLAAYLGGRDVSDAGTQAVLAGASLRLVRERPALRATHFAAAVRRRAAALSLQPGTALHSSLDAQLQADAERFLVDRLRDLRHEGARHGALLLVDLADNCVRAWAVADSEQPDVAGVDAVTAPRQPGSTLKPLLYALAFEQGWGPATRIDDAPLAEAVGSGLHAYRNYSRVHYGAVSAREALGNSLNIPAVKTLQFVGAARFLERLQAMGVSSLDRHPDVYGDGLALGNGEVSLYELVQAYSVLAREGRYRPLTLFEAESEARAGRAVLQASAARAINHILSDPAARALEFGDGGVLRFPARTAVKTGTSSDYRDAWTLAYTGSWLVGVWVGDLSGRETRGVTGARGPALLARSLLAGLDSDRPLPADAGPAAAVAGAADPRQADTPRLIQPHDGLQLALDPRIPDALQAFDFQLAWRGSLEEVRWYLDDVLAAVGPEPRWTWPLVRGAHRLRAVVVTADNAQLVTPEVGFHVR